MVIFSQTPCEIYGTHQLEWTNERLLICGSWQPVSFKLVTLFIHVKRGGTLVCGQPDPTVEQSPIKGETRGGHKQKYKKKIYKKMISVITF